MPLAYALIHEEDGVFGISFPDFPGCVSTGRTEEEVLRKGAEALAFHVAGMIEDGDPLPIARNLSELRADNSFSDDSAGAILALVPFDPPGRAVRLNISMDETLLEAVDRAASAAGQSRSAFLAEAVRRRLKDAA
ncbi:type II toxin-antitoxin system HicB family antitoxin [Kumtagia ephedrae]|jgi:predicted RNase H-like HicB family nuclease|uniref:HicB family protein n=1 Tax=Kumtagia ephedrae TaxID=2116701 RepID=A0A2P7S3A4_9HYPH|nr:type II toxin-antitoxin system HicB family antitoxin [Mesorhizobium ephedrae]PSJ56936.1 HicB family protein [Mesorhizobium ephedrae]